MQLRWAGGTRRLASGPDPATDGFEASTVSAAVTWPRRALIKNSVMVFVLRALASKVLDDATGARLSALFSPAALCDLQ